MRIVQITEDGSEVDGLGDVFWIEASDLNADGVPELVAKARFELLVDVLVHLHGEIKGIEHDGLSSVL